MFKLIEKYWPPSFRINRADGPYLHRWYLIPKNRWFNIYLHHFLNSDDEVACHNHPWWSFGFILKGSYIEITPSKEFGHHIKSFRPKLRGPNYYHRIKLYNKYFCPKCRKLDPIKSGLTDQDEYNIVEWSGYTNLCPQCDENIGVLKGKQDVWTLFITGPKLQSWGFLCPKGHVHYTEVVGKIKDGLHEGSRCPD